MKRILVPLDGSRLSEGILPLATVMGHGHGAELLLIRRQYVEAQALQNRALQIFEKKLGPAHVNTASALHNLGAIHLKQERYKEAEQYFRRALAAKEKLFKPANLSVAHSLDALSAALDGQGRQIEAERYKRRAQSIRLRVTAAGKPGA